MFRAFPRLAILVIAAVALSLVLWGSDEVDAGGRPPMVAVALEGDPAPGTGGATFAKCQGEGAGTYEEPMVNTAGDVLFWSCTSDNGFGLFLTLFNGPTTPVMLSGQTIPGIGTLPSSSADARAVEEGPALNNRQTAVFVIDGHITGTNAPDSVLFQRRRNQDIEPLLKTGDTSPCGGTFRLFDDVSINNKGDIAFWASYDDVMRKSGVFLRLSNGTVEKILCTGDSLPGTGTPNETFLGVGTDDVGGDGPWVNDNQTVVFEADKISGPTMTDPDSGDIVSIWEGSVFAVQHGGAIEKFLMIGESIPAAVGGGVIHSIAMARPALNNDNVIGFNLARETKTDTHPAEQFVASKKLGSSTIDICLEDLGPAPDGGTFEGFSAVTINQKGRLQFHADIDTDPTHEDPNNNDADNKRGIFTCKGGDLTTIVKQTDSGKPRGTSWSFNMEEGAVGGPFVTFIDERADSNPSTDRGVFLSGSQEDLIQGNFLCPDGHVDDLDILQLLKFEAGVPGITSAGVNICPGLGQLEPISGFKWGDINCDGAVDSKDILFMIADKAGVPMTAATSNCYQIGEVITQ